MAVAAIVYTYAVSYIWAMWRLRNREENISLENLPTAPESD